MRGKKTKIIPKRVFLELFIKRIQKNLKNVESFHLEYHFE